NADIQAAISYAAELAREGAAALPLERIAGISKSTRTYPRNVQPYCAVQASVRTPWPRKTQREQTIQPLPATSGQRRVLIALDAYSAHAVGDSLALLRALVRSIPRMFCCTPPGPGLS